MFYVLIVNEIGMSATYTFYNYTDADAAFITAQHDLLNVYAQLGGVGTGRLLDWFSPMLIDQEGGGDGAFDPALTVGDEYQG